MPCHLDTSVGNLNICIRNQRNIRCANRSNKRAFGATSLVLIFERQVFDYKLATRLLHFSSVPLSFVSLILLFINPT